MPEGQPPPSWHTLKVATIVRDLESHLQAGLTEEEAERRLAAHGPNELPEAPPTSPFKIFLAQFTSLIIWVLIGAAVLSGLLGEWVDTAAILAIVILNAILGFVQEYRAERSLAALRKLAIAMARVVRGGSMRMIPARELVPGDLIEVEAGDHVSADARLSYATALRTQEATLTGESTPVTKRLGELPAKAAPLGDRHNILFMGTDVTAGKGRALVVATGLKTELGRIAAMLRFSEEEMTPLQRRLEQLGHILLYLSVGVVTLVFALGLLRGEELLRMFLTAVSLAVAAIPESLPAIVTITLALGVTRMVRRHTLIRRLPAVETLGSTTVICTDKTGTLTKNEMTVVRLHLGGRTFEVTGEGYLPVGEIHVPGQALTDQVAAHVRELLTAATLCNGATLREYPDGWRIIGDPTEGALLVSAAKLGLWKEPLEAEQPFLGELPFDPERKMMTVVRRSPRGPVAYVKGAPDVLLHRCTHWLTREGVVEPLSDATASALLEINASFAEDALRVLGLARKQLESVPEDLTEAELERDLVFLGLAAMRDPLRPEAKEAVAACRDAGIRTVMITGDHKNTAIAIARDLGIVNGQAEALSGQELDALNAGALTERVGQVGVYARVSAEHKFRIVRAWKATGAVVAMTGDGVNDAPAIKAADIGVSMGLTGTDVTKEASDMVVTDDNFASIAAAVEEGRGVYDNILKAVHFLLSCNISEVLVMLMATLFGFPLPLLPVQILWINLVTDGFPALALAVDPTAPDLMRRPPRRPQAPILARGRMLLMFGQGFFMALVSILAFTYCLYIMEQPIDTARTVAFTVLVMVQLSHAFNCRSERYSLFALGLWSNPHLIWAVAGSTALQAAVLLLPWTQDVFKVTSLTVDLWILVFLLGVLPLIAMELWKAAQRSR